MKPRNVERRAVTGGVTGGNDSTMPQPLQPVQDQSDLLGNESALLMPVKDVSSAVFVATLPLINAAGP